MVCQTYDKISCISQGVSKALSNILEEIFLISYGKLDCFVNAQLFSRYPEMVCQMYKKERVKLIKELVNPFQTFWKKLFKIFYGKLHRFVNAQIFSCYPEMVCRDLQKN